MQLRDYQQKALDLTRAEFAKGKKKVLIFLATGGGKGLIMSQIANDAIAKNNKVLFVMRRRALIYQTVNNLKKYHNIISGVVMASEKQTRHLPVQVCSIDTLGRRLKSGDLDYLKAFSIIVVDEAHDALSDTYKNLFNFLGEKYYIGLTATPFAVGKRGHTFWDSCAKPIETHELKERGFLVPTRLYVPHEINLSSVKIDSTGDYNNKELFNKMTELEVVGDIVEDYKKLGENKAAICFCVNKNHSKIMAEEFNLAGIPAIHCDESTPQSERDAAIKKLRSGEIKILCNVNIFSTGVDIPEAEVGIMARPTRSEILYIQQVGRLLRPYRKCGRCFKQYDNSPQCPVCAFTEPSYIKQHAIIIDSGNNISRFGDPYDVRYPVLSDEKTKTKKEPPLLKVCKQCFLSYPANKSNCPVCGVVTDLPETIVKTKKGELVPYDEYTTIVKAYEEAKKNAIFRNWKPVSVYFKLYERFGDKLIKYSKDIDFPTWIPKVVKENKLKELQGKYITGGTDGSKAREDFRTDNFIDSEFAPGV